MGAGSQRLLAETATVYEWMHPSCRDLIIEHLACNPGVRREFLGKCGKAGLLLALSTGGGEHGARAFPLTSHGKDWELIGVAVERVLNDSQQEDARQVLTALADAFGPKTGSKARCPPTPDDRASISRIALEACRKKRDAEQTTLKTSVLESYYRLSAANVPLIPSPELGATWDSRWQAALPELEADEDDFDIQEDPVQAWVNLAQLLSEYEPRFLLFVGYPSSHAQPMKRFLARLKAYAESDLSFYDKDEYEYEIAHLYYLSKLVESIASTIPNTQEMGAEVDKALSSLQSSLESECWEQFPEPESAEWGERRSLTGGFDVDEFFADL